MSSRAPLPGSTPSWISLTANTEPTPSATAQWALIGSGACAKRENHADLPPAGKNSSWRGRESKQLRGIQGSTNHPGRAMPPPGKQPRSEFCNRGTACSGNPVDLARNGQKILHSRRGRPCAPREHPHNQAIGGSETPAQMHGAPSGAHTDR